MRTFNHKYTLLKVCIIGEFNKLKQLQPDMLLKLKLKRRFRNINKFKKLM